MEGSVEAAKLAYTLEMRAYIQTLLEAELRKIREAGGEVNFDFKAILQAASTKQVPPVDEHQLIGEQLDE